MSILRSLMIMLAAMLVLSAAVTGVGIGALVAADGLDSTASLMVLALTVAAFVGLLLGAGAITLLSKGLKSELMTAVDVLGSTTSRLFAVASQVASATAQTAAATNETTATVEEVRQTATLAQEKASEVSDLAHTLVEASKFSERSAGKNRSHFERIESDMDVVAEAIDRLDQETQSIGEIITTVSDLAEQSKQSVARVRDVLGEIQKAGTMVVRAAEQGRETVGMGREEADLAVSKAGERVVVATEAAEAASQISATCRQQLAGMEQISQAILSIAEAERQSVFGARQVEEEVRLLEDVSMRLKRLAGVET